MSPRKNDYDWSDQAIERLRLLRTAGLTTGKIAQIFGLTRNAICGKLKRLDPPLPKRVKIMPEAQKQSGKRQPFKIQHTPQEPEPMPEMKTVAVEANPTPLVLATHEQCRWVLDGYDVPTVCGAPGYPWCSTHRARVYSQHSPRKELAA